MAWFISVRLLLHRLLETYRHSSHSFPDFVLHIDHRVIKGDSKCLNFPKRCGTNILIIFLLISLSDNKPFWIYFV